MAGFGALCLLFPQSFDPNFNVCPRDVPWAAASGSTAADVRSLEKKTLWKSHLLEARKHLSPSACFSDLLEVGDAIEAFSTPTFNVTLNGVAYHPQDAAFFSWFAHQSPSIGTGGRYSYVSPAKLTSRPPSCT